MIVVGSLRAGGAGKTAVVLELGKHLSARSLKVGILAYWVRKQSGETWMEVSPESKWNLGSDEAILLARESHCRVFVTRNRELTWDYLSRSREFDLLISDDGLMDPRLDRAFRIALRKPDESPGIFDLIPAGPYRLTVKTLDAMDCVVEGPAWDERMHGLWFRRKLIFPQGFDPSQRWWALCGLGNPENFREDLIASGVNLIGISKGPDHGIPDLKRAIVQATRAKATGFLCTAKDGIKLREHAAKLGSISVIQERIELAPGLIEVVEKRLGLP